MKDALNPSSGKTPVFVSFDVENDRELYEHLLLESQNSSSSFSVLGSSEGSETTDAWSDRARRRIRAVDQMIVICGEHTEMSTRVSAELRIAQQEGTPYILLWGRRDTMCTKPVGAKHAEGMYSWTQQVLQEQISFARRKAHADATAESLVATLRKG